jgi:sulfite exporter TauE/SafE
MVAIVLGRTLRFAVVSYITIRFGAEIAKQTLAAVAKHLPWVLAAFLLAFALYFIHWMRGRKGREELLEM